MNPKDKIDEKKEFEMSFDDLDTAKAKAEAEARGETVDDDKTKVEKQKVETDDTEEEEEEDKTETQDKSKETKKEDKVPAKEDSKKEVPKNNFPKKNEGESDAAYNLRIQLEVAKQGRDAAGTEEEKSVYEQRMDDLRKNLSEVNKDSKKEEVKKESADEEEETSTKISEAELKKLGFIKKEEVESVFQQRLNEMKKDEIIESHQQAIREFYKTRPEFLENKDARNFLEKEVIDLIKPDLNTTGKQLFNALKLVSDAKFPKPNKSEAATRSQEKVDAMNIEGNSKGSQKKATVGEKENDLLRSMGWTDEQIQSFG